MGAMNFDKKVNRTRGNPSNGGFGEEHREDKLNNSGISWVDRVRVASKNFGFKLKQIQHNLSNEFFEVPDTAMADDQDEWIRCLIGFIPGYTMSFHAVRKLAERAWGSYGLESVKTVKGFLIFRFAEKENLQKVLDDGPWLFGNKAMVLQQWNPGFIFNKNQISKIPVWVRLHNLPFPLWSHEGLSFAASIVGVPIACDPATHHKTKMDYARVCVEVDASRPYRESFSLTNPLFSEPVKVMVEYEWQPKRCPTCCFFGHICSETNAKNEDKEKFQNSTFEIGNSSKVGGKDEDSQSLPNGSSYQTSCEIKNGPGKTDDGRRKQEIAESKISENAKVHAVHDEEQADMNTENDCCTPEVGVQSPVKSDTEAIIRSGRRRRRKEFLDLSAAKVIDSDESSCPQEDENQEGMIDSSKAKENSEIKTYTLPKDRKGMQAMTLYTLFNSKKIQNPEVEDDFNSYENEDHQSSSQDKLDAVDSSSKGKKKNKKKKGPRPFLS